VRAVEVGEDRLLATVELETPRPGAGEALLDVAFCGICGSDLHFRDVPELFPAGSVPGHELSGRIAALGDQLDARWQIGARVTVLPFAQCGECELCLAGEEQVCPQAVARGVGLGTGRRGGYAEQIIVDERMLFELPTAVDDRAGALTEPLAVAVRAVAQSGLREGQAAAVIGAGPIGILTALVLADRGHRDVTVLSRNPARRQLAASLGFRAVSAQAPDGASASAPAVVFECAGTPAAARLAFELVAPVGRVMLVGVSLEPLELPVPPILFKEATLRGILTYTRADFAAAIEMLARGAIPVEAIVTAVAPLADAEACFRTLTSPGNANLKILLEP
jgi:2-desacetyl-2-hydroxyethyl bacteriochlorophyllide A dehydrogenase